MPPLLPRPPARTFGEICVMRLPWAGPAPDPSTPIEALAVDSRKVRPGTLFVAMPGVRLDGASFAQYAVRQGAVGVVCTPAGLEVAKGDIGDLPVPFFLHQNPRAELARLASAFHASQPEVIAAVTGTNGKTSTAHFLRQIWAYAGERAAAFGTTGVEGEGFDEPLSHTTPEPITLHALLARLAEKGCSHAAMEASSHGLAQHRLDGVRLRAAALTNITRDHMDYHASHADYVAAKLRLFGEVLPSDGVVVTNADDATLPQVHEIAGARGLDLLTVGAGAETDLRVHDQRFEPDGQSIALVWQGRFWPIRLPLIGAFQAENVAIAAALALATGIAAEEVFAALPRLTGVKGRMEHVATRVNGAPVYVDYAHTPDALVSALRAIRPHVAGRLIVVGGAGGDRDPGKRPLMGRAMAEGADAVIVTDDNPRSEDPALIRSAVMEGCPEADNIGDRAEAILAGVDSLKSARDCLLIAGKGHEQGQEVGGAVIPFDDGDQARAAVAVLDGELEL
ncbi:MAG: UDP-N-acetylmuramoyl-L-alanyl-D-glutamate--2,6-diaminopimelate ligase [Pseudomonadota bacterium]